MKFNKRGWGLVGELVVVLLVVAMLVYVIYGLNNLGLIRDMDKALGTDVFPDLVISGKTVSYSSVEDNLISASQKYVSDNYGNNIDTAITIRVSHLIKNGYISTIRDKDNKECSGYVIVSKLDEDIIYTPYLKCDEYETKGYNEKYDW